MEKVGLRQDKDLLMGSWDGVADPDSLSTAPPGSVGTGTRELYMPP